MRLEKITDDRQRWYDDACGTALAMELMGERWSMLIVRELMFGPRRFGEVRAGLPGISANVLTQRLEGLIESGIATKRHLPSPANVQVYDLTDWGRDAGPLIRQLGHWAARSPRHDRMAFMSPASAMMSLEALVDRDRAVAQDMTIAFRFPADAFVARVDADGLSIRRGEDAGADATFTGDTLALRMTIYGKVPFDAAEGMAVDGDRTLARRFVDLFRLPEKIA
ncbi:transcriptional regulator [Sphingomonas sp. Leaf412]|uniref:winged helix-turn-helix transcriptional regulator n=1 Tax=Sphingomonas sp. Leaf412 TaxID=1736370 RepID=UPI0006F8C3DF|nr:winged helix-turn-helix transcriptional regulator [Sphingomonas sp. Leaf412]KQT34831.1 transcriptional regulator [Sphingomonas sp. Leaf412]